MNPAAKSIQESFERDEGQRVAELEAEFMELVIWYEGFINERKLRVLPFTPDDVAVIVQKMNEARAAKDYKTSDFLRGVLRQCGLDELAKNK